jgi:hypothetical protein
MLRNSRENGGQVLETSAQLATGAYIVLQQQPRPRRRVVQDTPDASRQTRESRLNFAPHVASNMDYYV